MFNTSLLTWRVSRSTQVFSQKSASMTPCISAVLFVTLVAPMWKFSPVLICAGPQASTIGLSPGRGRFVIAVKAPSNTFLSSRHNPAEPSVEMYSAKKGLSLSAAPDQKGHCPRSAVHALCCWNQCGRDIPIRSVSPLVSHVSP